MRFLTFIKKWLGGSEALQESLGGGQRASLRDQRASQRGKRASQRGSEGCRRGQRGCKSGQKASQRGQSGQKASQKGQRGKKASQRGQRDLFHMILLLISILIKKTQKIPILGGLRLLTLGAHPRPFQTDMKDEFHSSTRSNAL